MTSRANAGKPSVLLTFDVEEHHRIEAAATLSFSVEQKKTYADRMESSTRRIADSLAAHQVRATFFIVGEIAQSHPKLIQEIVKAGHEIGSHSHDHRRVHRFDPTSFREDLKKSKDALEQTTGQKVFGFRAPTFSIVRQTAWAIDALIDCGFEYDSSIFPVRHDRYGIPDAPRSPFYAKGNEKQILELPPATYRFLGQNLPVAGGGYFRLFPLMAMKAGIKQLGKKTDPAVAMLYFHPWEFDPGQPELQLGKVSRFRTYVGIKKSMGRLEHLMKTYPGQFQRTIDFVNEIRNQQLPVASMV
jgi:polysaccharide deacetylase family protein (PEP-CTERM system associated)